MDIYNIIFLLILTSGYAESSYPSRTPPTYPNPVFVPAMPGKTPSCVKDPRLTFCINPDKYPKDRIIYLVEQKMFDTDTLLQDETRDTYTFETREAGVISVSSTMPYGKGYPLPKTPTHYLPPNSTNYSYRRPSKYGGGPQRLKPPPSPIPPYSTNQFYSPDATPSLNSFTSYPSKQPNYNGRSTPHYPDAGPYPRYSRNRQWTTTPPYQPSGTQQSWWKKILRREKRQADLNDLCPARADYIMPRAAQRVDDGDWMFLVNVDERYTQLVKSETCIQNTCEGACDVPDGFSAICQQQYVQKRLIALDGSGEKLNSDVFWFPSCCICKIRDLNG